MEIEINGERRTVRAGLTLSDLIAELELQPQFLAVERNGQVVPRAQHATCVLAAGDCLEIVTLVGGG